MGGPALPSDYDADPGRFAVNRAATAAYSTTGDVHAPVARRLAALGVRHVVDLAGGDGTLVRELTPMGVRSVVVDEARHVSRAPRPAVRADVRSLPFRQGSFDAACCLWALYHLDDPREAARVLRPGGWFVASTSARTNDLEFAEVLPGWAATGSFDAEDAAGIVGSVMADVQVEHWDAPMIELPDRAAVRGHRPELHARAALRRHREQPGQPAAPGAGRQADRFMGADVARPGEAGEP